MIITKGQTHSRLVSASEVRRRLGDISDMTLWRRMHDEEQSFPKPLVISRRRFWDEADIEAYIARAKTAAV